MAVRRASSRCCRRCSALTLRIILRTVFGVEEGARMAELERRADPADGARRADHAAADAAARLGPGSPQRQFEAARAEVDELAVRRDRAGDELARRATDVLSMLLQARGEDGEPPSDAELRDHLITLLLAGHETTATSSRGRSSASCATRRRSSARLRATTAYIDAVVQESQRLRPVITYVMRTLQAPMTVGGHEVPAGATLGTSITLMHRRADLYPDPLAFRPERFLEAKPETYTWIAVRRRRAALPRRRVRRASRCARCSTWCSPARRCARADPRPERYRRRGITFVPGRGARVTAQPAVERLEAVGVLLVDHVALDLQRRGQLARLLREVVVEDRELLDLLDLGVVAVDVVEDRPGCARGPSDPPPARPRRRPRARAPARARAPPRGRA